MGEHSVPQVDCSRIIAHFDVDCFYAQTEVLKQPHLRDRPVGITQKFLVVTCNYLARQRGVPKMASIEETQRRCPDIVLINGEDLTPYRAASREIMNVLRRFGTLERSGLDECSIDITSETKKRAALGSFPNHFVGFVVGFESVKEFEKEHMKDETTSTGCNLGHLSPYSASESKCEGVSASARNITSEIENEFHSVSSDGRNLLMVGSHLVAEIRAIVEAETGFQCSCGISYNLPGVGHRTESMLMEIGIQTVADLQICSLHELLQMFGEKTGRFLFNGCRGVDLSPVRDKGPQKSVSVEDSFPPCTSLKRIECILSSLALDFMARLDEDKMETGRAPRVFTIKWRQKGSGNFTSASTQMPSELLSTKCTMDRRKQILVQTGMSLVSRSLRGHSFSVVVLNIGATNFTDANRGISSASQDIRSLLQNSTKIQETHTSGKDEILFFRNVVKTDHSRNSHACPSLFGQRLSEGSIESPLSGEMLCKSSLELRKAIEEQCKRNDMTKLNASSGLEDGNDDVCRPLIEDVAQITVSSSFICRADYFQAKKELAEENSRREVLSFPCDFEKQTETADSGNLESRACVAGVSVDIESDLGETSPGSIHVQGGNREQGSTRKRGFEMEENGVMGSFVCEKCGQKVGCDEQQKQEHEDYHYALELHSKDTNEWRKQSNLLAKNFYPKKRNQNLTLDSFFSRSK
ncbi:uncharacterized protein LOC131052518 isoform X2 [Cryptomeria japonica]|uniref:uncharacterized protein LOC131052518 isoform X2 n=1 Tax=Cryptomeria japonica TaxID=3369 RepID=UPI0027DA9740|nr:uncharacterized protein LOC131052518 isoform X2 [Cryptomeria japonica]